MANSKVGDNSIYINPDISKSLVKGLKASSSNNEWDDSDDFFAISLREMRIPTQNWKKFFAYRLLIVRAKDTNPADYEIVQDSTGKQLIYNLPINPQNIVIQMPFASVTTILADGVLVESNGSPLKNIAIQGTTGLVPFRDTEATSYDSSLLSAFAPNIARSIGGAASAAKSIGSNAAEARAKNLIFENTGYAQFHKLSQFLQYFAFLSKQTKNKDLRLVLDMLKDNTTYLVTPKNFALQRAADSPLEYRYTIQLEAWKRISLNSAPAKDFNTQLAEGFLDKMRKVMSAIRGVFRVISQAKSIIGAIRADINRILDTIRTVAVLVKNIMGDILAIIDLPLGIMRDTREALDGLIGSVVGGASSISSAASGFNNQVNKIWNGFITNKTNAKLTGLTDSSLIPKSGAGVGTSSTVQQRVTAQGSKSDSSSTPSPTDQSLSTKNKSGGTILAKAFDKPYDNFDFFDKLNVSDLNLSSNIKSKINDEINRVNQLTRSDYEDIRDYLDEVSADLATAFGHGSNRLNSVKGYVAGPKTPLSGPLGRQQFQILSAFRKLSQTIDLLTFRDFKGGSPVQNSFNFIGGILNNTNIEFSSNYAGKFAVPFPYGGTLQQLAKQYLGSEDRFTEIILLNNLQSPYIDEDGQYQSLTSDSYKNIFNISDGSELYLNQILYFTASNRVPFSRQITAIKQIDANNWQVSVSGDDLNLQTSRSAKVQYFQKNTVSSRNLIFIPTKASPAGIPDRIKPIPAFENQLNPLIQIAGIDIALGSDNGLILSSSGELSLAGGLTNLLQALKLKMITPKGALSKHDSYGFGVQPGTPTSEIDFENLRNQIAATILSDPRFSEVNVTDLSYSNATLSIAGTVSISGVNVGVVPFSLSV